MPVSIDTSMLVNRPAVTTKLLGREEEQPMKVQFDRFREYEPGAREVWSVPTTAHPVEVQSTGKLDAWPGPDGVTTAWMEEYELGAGPAVALTLHTGWVGPTEKVASRVPEPAPMLVDDALTLVVVDEGPAPAPTVKWATTTDPHSSPAATV